MMNRTESSALSIKEGLRLALTEGERDLTVSLLCRRAGIARATFYLHFKSIEEVFIAVIDDIFHSLEHTAKVQDDSADTPRFVRTMVNASQTHRPVLLGVFDLGMLDILARRARSTVTRCVLLMRPELEKKLGEESFEDAISFIVGGSALLMETWIRRESQVATSEISHQLVNMSCAALTAIR